MRRLLAARLCCAACLCLWAAHAAAAKPDTAHAALAEVPARFAVHDAFDRLVLSLPAGAQAVSRQSGDTLCLNLPGEGTVARPSRLGPRLRGLDSAPQQATLHLAHNARVRVWHLGDRLVIDVLDPSPALSAPRASAGVVAIAASARPTPGPDMPGQHRLAPGKPDPGKPRSVASTRPALPAPPLTTAPEPRPAPAASPTLPGNQPSIRLIDVSARAMPGQLPTQTVPGTSTTVGSAASDASLATVAGSAVLPLAGDDTVDGPAMLVPCPHGTGAAAFERAGEAHIVFDLGKPLDLSALKDNPVFGEIREQVLSDGLELRLHLPAGSQIRLLSRPGGWAVIALPATHNLALPVFTGRVHGGTLALEAKQTGQIVVLADEVTGNRLLVATQAGTGQRMPVAHATPDFTILPSWFGLVIAPISDRLVLRKTPSGLELSTRSAPDLSLAWSDADAVSWPDGRAMTRLFDLPDLPPDGLHRRLDQALRDAALVAVPARFGPRLAVARGMLAQGMDVEAAAVLHTATADDPAQLGDPDVAGLSAIAAWLSAKAGGADPPGLSFDPARLGNSDEAALWRALLQPSVPDLATQAAHLAPVWPLILKYPQALRRPMLLASSALLQAGGQIGAWAALLAASSDPALDLSRAALLQHQGKTDDALALMDGVVARPDRLARADAAWQAIELRLATHRLNAAAAADELDRQLYAWRGGDRELKLRMRVAGLRAQSGDWRAALTTLRQAEQLFPDSRAVLHEAEEKTVTDLLGGERAGKLASFELVTLAEEAANLFSSADVERRLGPILVDRLLALDLPDRAEPILRKLFDRAPDSTSKAQYGLGLASLVADRGDTQAALDVLGAQDEAGLPPGLDSKRTLLRGRLLGASGKVDQALSTLAGQHGPEASEIQAGLLEQQKNWPAASVVLGACMRQPEFSALPETVQRTMVLRLARDLTAAGDVVGLHTLRDAQLARFATGDGAALFAVLTADPIKSQADLPRSARELAGLRALPALLAQPRAF